MILIRSKAIRRAARGEECTLQLYGICNHDPETTVFAHFRDEEKGMGQKSNDTSGCFACNTCHQALDEGTHGKGVEIYKHMLRAMQRTIKRLVERGIIIVPLDPPRKHKPAQRKPKNQRQAIQSRGFQKSKWKHSQAQGKMVER